MVARKFKLVPYNIREAGNIADAIAISLTIEGRALKPYVPVNFCANGGSFAARYNTDIVLTWSPRYRGKGAGIGIPGIVLADADWEGLFKIEVLVGGVCVRTEDSIDGVTWTYTSMMNLADNSVLANEIIFGLLNYRTEDGVPYESDHTWVICRKN